MAHMRMSHGTKIQEPRYNQKESCHVSHMNYVMLFETSCFFWAIMSPQRMAEQDGRKSKRSQTTQKNPEREILTAMEFSHGTHENES